MNAEIEEYRHYFLDETKKFYGSTSGHGHESGYFAVPKWSTPSKAICEQFSQARSLALRTLEGQEVPFVSVIDGWLGENQIPSLSFHAEGNLGAVFAAKLLADHEGRTAVRLGPGSPKGKFSLINDRAWSPLGLKPYVHVVFESDDEQFNLEVLPFLGVVSSYAPRGFKEFLDRHVLCGTPFHVNKHVDLGVLSNGTPVYVDPDSLSFKNRTSAEQHAKNQFNPAWQQEQMSIIHANCEKLALPEPLRWVVSTPKGFVTKQDLLYPNPFPGHPERRTIILDTRNTP